MIYIVRHTAVDVPKGVCYGQTDVPLKNSFREEAEKVRRTLSSLRIEQVFSSPLSRCRRLAEYCGYGNAILDNRLMELHFGDWEACKWDDVDMSVWEGNEWMTHPAPHGESFMQMYNRVASFFNELKEGAATPVVIFAHGGVIRCAEVYFGRKSIAEAFMQTLDYGVVVEYP